jgi:hypothetical protein
MPNFKHVGHIHITRGALVKIGLDISICIKRCRIKNLICINRCRCQVTFLGNNYYCTWDTGIFSFWVRPCQQLPLVRRHSPRVVFCLFVCHVFARCLIWFLCAGTVRQASPKVRDTKEAAEQGRQTRLGWQGHGKEGGEGIEEGGSLQENRVGHCPITRGSDLWC